jgi:hypothetical protein
VTYHSPSFIATSAKTKVGEMGRSDTHVRPVAGFGHVVCDRIQ